jgi:hypothetical protein
MRLADTLDAAAPPAGLTPPQEALWWLAKGRFAPGPAWERAHAICQTQEGEPAHDLVHALAHWIEGDLGNAEYWWRRAGSRRMTDAPQAEWARIAAEFGV